MLPEQLIVPFSDACMALGICRSTGHLYVKQGLLPQPISRSRTRIGFPRDEVKTIANARRAGMSTDGLRALVLELMSARPKTDDVVRFDPNTPQAIEGRKKFWDDVKAGRRLHPRTAARLKREAAQSATVADRSQV
jgi:hypothetical protein